MPWTEPAGDDSWRVRYRREQRAGTWIDLEDGRTTIAEFAPPGSTPSTSTNAPKRTTSREPGEKLEDTTRREIAE